MRSRVLCVHAMARIAFTFVALQWGLSAARRLIKGPDLRKRVSNLSAEVYSKWNLSSGAPPPTFLPSNLSENAVQNRSSFAQIANNSEFPEEKLETEQTYCYSKRLAKGNRALRMKRSLLGTPVNTVVFFPGDISDYRKNQPGLPFEYTIDAMHMHLATRFPDYDVLTIIGELRGEERTFNAFPPEQAIARVEEELEDRRTGNIGNLILVGFSRGGLMLSRMISNAGTDPDFWQRVESIHYIDVGGLQGFSVQEKALKVLQDFNPNIWFNFQNTNAFKNMGIMNPMYAKYVDDRQLYVDMVSQHFATRVDTLFFPGKPEDFDLHMKILYACHMDPP